MIHKENWEETQKHLDAFWNKDYENRCNLAMRVPWAEGNQDALPPLDCSSLEEAYTSPDYLYARWKRHSLCHQFFGEGIPVSNLDFGTAGHATYFGAKPHYAPDTIWFSPTLEEPDAALLRYDPEEKAFKKHQEITAALARKAAGEFMVAMPDNCGIIDALAALRGPENLLLDMIENPEFVHEACRKITEAWKTTQSRFFEILAENNQGGSSHSWMQLWCPKRHAQIQCDFSVMISPAMFEEFVLPEIEECAEFLDCITYHLDGQEQIRHLDLLLSVKKLDNIQWTPVAGQPRTSTFIKEFQKIQAAGKGLVLIPEKDEVPILMENLSHKGLHLIVNDVSSPQEAEDLLRLAEKLAH